MTEILSFWGKVWKKEPAIRATLSHSRVSELVNKGRLALFLTQCDETLKW